MAIDAIDRFMAPFDGRPEQVGEFLFSFMPKNHDYLFNHLLFRLQNFTYETPFQTSCWDSHYAQAHKARSNLETSRILMAPKWEIASMMLRTTITATISRSQKTPYCRPTITIFPYLHAF
jgi:hypothetical protein